MSLIYKGQNLNVDNTSIKSILEIFNETAKFTENKGFAIIVNKKRKCMKNFWRKNVKL